MGKLTAGGYQGPARTSCSLRDCQPSTITQQAGQGPHCPGPLPQYVSKVSQAGPEITAGFDQEPASPGKFTAMRQVQGQAEKSSDRSGVRIDAVHGQANPRLRLNQSHAVLQRSSKRGKVPKPELPRAYGPVGQGVFGEAPGEAHRGC